MWWEQHWAELVGLLFVAVQAGTTIAQLAGVNRRLDVVNGRLNNHGQRVGELEQSDAEIRGTLGMQRR